MQTKPTQSEYFPALDGLRAMAIIIVLAHHLLMLPHTPTRVDQLIGYASRPLWIGVDLFFVLSGFLITNTLVKTKNKSKYFTNFFARRSLRILPIHFISLAIFLHVLPLFSWCGFDAYRGISTSEKSAFWLYYINYYHATTLPAGNLGHFWSLCVEQHFYLFWPIVIWASRRYVLHLTIAGILLTTILRFIANHTGWWTIELGYHASHLRMDSLLFGSLAYCLHERYGNTAKFRTIVSKTVIPLIFLTILTLGFGNIRSSPHGNMIGFPLIGLTMASVLTFVLISGERNAFNKFLLTPIMSSIGKYSYAIYIFHSPILFLSYQIYGNTPQSGNTYWPNAILPVLTTLITTAVLSILSWHLVESPMLSLKRYFRYK